MPDPTTANDVAIYVRLPADLRQALKAEAVAQDRSIASLLRLAAREYLAQSTRKAATT